MNKNYIAEFDISARRYAEEIALVDREGARASTYGELDLTRRRVAAKLLALGLAPGTPVLLRLGRCREYAAAWLGVMTAGCAAVPVLPEYPDARAETVREDCGAPLVIGEAFFDGLDAFAPSETVTVTPDTPAYIIYTSGSTGRPKGILYTAGSLYSAVTVPGETVFDIGERPVVGMTTSFSFALCMYDFLYPLLRGGTVHIVADAARKDAALLADYFLRHRINIGVVSPQLLRRFRCRSPYLRRVFAGGEVLSGVFADGYEILNVYGASETGLTCCFRLDRAYRNTPVGKPFPGYEYLLCPAGGEPSAQAEEGELYVTGEFAREYLHQPERTAETFRALPDGRTLYRTGDIVRRDADGNYVFVSRADWMVKVNGHRVETMEVENVLKELPGVENAAVRAFTDEDGQTWLCAYCALPGAMDEKALRAQLGAKVPDYMQPRFLVRMDALPLTASGKVDRQALTPPSLNDFKAPYRAPAEGNETLLCRAFEAVLRCGRVGADDDFFALGGDSIKVLLLAEELEKAAGLTVSAAEVFARRTPAALADVLRKAPAAESPAAARDAAYPMTEAQRGVYMECLEDPSSTKYNIPVMLRLPASVDPDRFADAVRRAAEKHPALSAGADTDADGTPVMVPGRWPVFTVTRGRADSAEKAAAGFVRPFELNAEKLCRFALYETPRGPVFLMDAHHIIFDGTSLRLLLGQIAGAYDGREIPDEKTTLADIAARERGIADTEAYAAARAFFRERFEGTDFDPSLIPDANAYSNGTEDGGEASFCRKASRLEIGAPQSLAPSAVVYRAGALGITESTLFMAAFAYALSVFRGSDEVCFSTVDSGRHTGDLAGSVGMFVRSLPVRFTVPEDGSCADFLRGVQRVSGMTMAHDCISFGELARAYGANLSVSFVYQAELLSEVRVAGENVLPEELPLNGCQSDILCMALKTADGYRLRVTYNGEKYTEGLIRSLSETVFTAAAGLLENASLAAIPLLSDAQRAFIGAFNRTERPYDPEETVQAVLEKRIAEGPERTALVCGENRYTYAAFDRLTAALAARIRGMGLGAEDYVAVLAPRSDAAVLAVWGAVRAGTAVQTLDPAYPAERLNYMVRDSGARLLIADRGLRPVLTGYTGETLFTDEIAALPEAPAPEGIGKPGDALALIYTSGTTGRPKGSVLENRNLAAFCRNHMHTMGIGPGSRVASYASFGFDAGLMDIITVPMAGAALYIMPDDIRLDIPRMDAFYCENGITHGFMTTQVGRMFALETKCATLRALLVGGEKLVPLTPPAGFRLVNGYGPCETMAYICSHDVTDNSPVQPIGAPAGNTKLYIADRRGRLLPPGAVGELCIAGLQVGRGYLGLPEKTAQVFVKNPYTGDADYARMYKTGDDARLLPCGELEYIGRRDGQVKIRGFRVELTEVEEVIRRFPGVEDATVAAFDEPSGGKYLAAYVAGAGEIGTEALRTFILKEKPDYMVPAVIMQLEKIPYTVNRKVDRRALPVPERKTEAPVPPANATERRIFALAAEVLGHESFGAVTDLFEAGLTSIGSLKLNLSLGKAFRVPLKIADLREHPTVRALAEFLGQAAPEEDMADTEASGEQPETPPVYPLMQSQLGVLLDAASADTTRYNIPVLLRVSGSLDSGKLCGAVRTAINAHPYMKVTLAADAKGNTVAVRHDAAEPAVDLVRADELPAPDALVRPFTLIGGRLYRACVYVTPGALYLFMDLHHIIADGTSAAVLLRDISAAYTGEPLVPETFTAFDLALENACDDSAGGRRVPDSDDSAEDAHSAFRYYEALLTGVNTDCLPAPCPEPAPAAACASRSFSFGGASAGILAYCRQNGISPGAFLHAVFARTLSGFLHAEDVTYCTVYSGRGDSRLADTVAMLVKTLPVHSAPDPDMPVKTFALDMQKQLLDTMAHDGVAFGELHDRFGVKPDLFFNYQGEDFAFDTLCGEKAELIPLPLNGAKAPLSAEIFLESGVFRAEFTWDTAIYRAELAEAFAGALITAAESMTRAERLKDVQLLCAAERAHFDRMNDTDVPFERVPAQALFERRAAETPERIAVQDMHTRLTYGELNAAAERVAAALAAAGAGPDEIIGLIPERNVLVPAAEIGVLKAGCAFLPMLPTYPDERLAFCMTDAGCRFVIAPRGVIEAKSALFAPDRPYRALVLEELLAFEPEGGPEGGRKALRDAQPDGITASEGGPEGDRKALRYAPHRLAYCIYTSGSTGTPKGVMIEQHSLSCFAQTAGLCETLDAGGTVLAMASVSFDMSVTEIFFSLCRGKTVYIAAEDEVHDLSLLLKAFEHCPIDLIMMTPSFAWNLLAAPEFSRALAGLKAVVLGAEAFQPALFDKLRALNPGLLIRNGYGPTETTQVCSAKTLESGEHITVGGPFANTRFHVTDRSGNLLPRYALGELLISGEGVCRGYVKQPEKNAAAFTELDGLRAYSSGDLVRVNADLEVEFGGRADRQVKLRGVRIELDEVESVMQAFPGVTRAAVTVRNNGREDFLAGYYTADRPVPADTLSAFMRTRLTYYMVPAAMLQLEKMPVTAGGKLDRKALPEIRPEKKDRPRRAPKKSLEQKITDLFRGVLNADECYPDDNFFEIGGTSLSASRVVMQLKADGFAVEYQDIFDHQTPAELAEYLEGKDAKGKPEGASEAEGAASRTPGSISESPLEVLKYNTLEYAPTVTRTSPGDVLLTGACGFLGAHVLKTLLDTEEGRVICLLRRGRYDDVVTRLRATLVYYFEDDCADALRDRVTVLEGDITDEDLDARFDALRFDTVINCAASVKHFANDASIETVNVRGVENLIRLARKHDAKLIQISTTSVPGVHTEETWRVNLRMPENHLFVIDDMNNQYVRSKYRAELLVLDAVRGGMRGKIIRVGNLMGRYSDGEFQTNMRTNAFLNGLRGFVNIGKCPLSHATDPMSFSPVDCTARAVVLLAGTDDRFTAFNADSRFTFDEMKVIDAVNRCGIRVTPVQDEEYYADYYRVMADPEKNAGVSALLTNDRPDVHPVETDNRFTANVLYRLGFSWPFIDDSYLEKIITGLDTLDFFEEE